MRQKSVPEKEPATQVVKNIRRATRRHFSAEDKIRIVLEGLRGEDSIAELCRREGIVQNLYYRWSKDFLEAGKKRLAGDTARAATRTRSRTCVARQRAEGGRGRADPRKSSAQKKRDGGWGGRRMRYPASEKLEIIRLVEESALPVRRTLEKIGIPPATFYRWYDLYQARWAGSPERPTSQADRVWNRIPDDVRERIIRLALDEPRCRRGNWPCGSRTPKAILSRRHRSIGSQGPRSDRQPSLHRDEGCGRVQG
jgi:Transposase.